MTRPYNGVHQFLGESAGGGRDAWRHAVDVIEALGPRSVVASHKDKALDDDAAVVTTQTRQYLDDADDQLTKNSTAAGFFNAMLELYPNRHLGATTLWAGTNALYAHTGNEAQDSLVGWFHPLLADGARATEDDRLCLVTGATRARRRKAEGSHMPRKADRHFGSHCDRRRADVVCSGEVEPPARAFSRPAGYAALDRPPGQPGRYHSMLSDWQTEDHIRPSGLR